jgi:hypothetical protein
MTANAEELAEKALITLLFARSELEKSPYRSDRIENALDYIGSVRSILKKIVPEFGLDTCPDFDEETTQLEIKKINCA